MAKKAAGTATIERGRLPGEIGEFDSIQDEQTEAMPTKADGPIASLDDAFIRAASVTPEQIAEVMGDYQFRGGWPGNSIHINFKLSPEESDSLRKLWIVLNGSNTRLANGKHVAEKCDVVRWLMEQTTQQIAGANPAPNAS